MISHEQIIFTKFHKDRKKTVYFLLMANFWTCIIFFYPVFRGVTFILGNCTVVEKTNQPLALVWCKMAFFKRAWHKVEVLPHFWHTTNSRRHCHPDNNTKFHTMSLPTHYPMRRGGHSMKKIFFILCPYPRIT